MSDPASRFRLFQLLADLPQPQFEGLLFALNIPSGNIPASSAPQAERVRAVLVWAESPIGCGLRPVAALARDMFGLDVPAFLADEPAAVPTVKAPASEHPSPALKKEAVAAPRPSANTNSVKQPAIPKTFNTLPKQPFAADLGNGTVLELVYVPSGTFWMGSPEKERDREDCEGPQRKVNVSEFWLGKYPVTQRQWYLVSFLDQVSRGLKPNPSKLTGDNLPVEQVSWDESVEFCARLSKYTGLRFRLPTEAEWEYACRAGTTTPYSFGENITRKNANITRNDLIGFWETFAGDSTTNVGSFPPNSFGLYDMHGNVAEWCEDIWHENYRRAPKDSIAWMSEGDSSKRVYRSGGWNQVRRVSRSAYRGWAKPGFTRDNIGLRVCCSATSLK